MSEQIYRVESDDTVLAVNTKGNGNLLLTTGLLGPGGGGGLRLVSIELDDIEVRILHDAMGRYLETRTLKFAVGDIVYEPQHYKRAAEVVSIMEDRVSYGAPYRIRIIDQAPGQPSTDYFSADQLVLVTKASDRKDLEK